MQAQEAEDRQISVRFPDIEISESLIRRFDQSGPRYTSYPTADRFKVGNFGDADYIEYLQNRAHDPNRALLSVYVHLPFCESLCYFCACNKIITRDHGRTAQYLDYVEKEMNLTSQYLGSDRRTAQLHLGGGTPTFLSAEELTRLMYALRSHFEFTPDAELGIEIDPRTVNHDTLAMLADLGFNRSSFGVQDFNPDVQAAVNRIQPLEMVERALDASRAAGFQSVNMDLIYGLPKQTYATFDRTLDEVLRLSPDRIALYNYAHLPTRFKAQRLILAKDLPSAEERLQIFLNATRRLLEGGYIYIGLDHFAKPDDELNLARLDHSLHRNFQGYTTRADLDMLGFGVSAIGKVGASYSAAVRGLNAYFASLDEDRLPIERGLRLTPDDLLRRDVIMTLMCSMPVNYQAVNDKHNIDFVQYFAPELERLRTYADNGLITLTDDGISVTPKGRLFVRAVAMVFDHYLQQPTGSTYSKLI